MIAVSLIAVALLSAASPSPELQRSFAPDTEPVRDRQAQTTGITDTPQTQPGRFDTSRFDSVTVVGLTAILDSAAAHRIPLAPLVNNAYRGSAVRASSRQILTTVRELYLAMVDAREALGEHSTVSELESGADAIRAGADGKALQAIRSTRPTSGSALGALMVFADIANARRGIPMNDARDAVVALARNSRTDETLYALQSVVARNSERGPGMAQDALKRYVKQNATGAPKNAPQKPATRPPSPPDAS